MRQMAKRRIQKKGFATKNEAAQHEAEMKTKLQNPTYTPVTGAGGKQTLKEYLEEWVENHSKANLRTSTFASYKGNCALYRTRSAQTANTGNVR